MWPLDGQSLRQRGASVKCRAAGGRVNGQITERDVRSTTRTRPDRGELADRVLMRPPAEPVATYQGHG